MFKDKYYRSEIQLKYFFSMVMDGYFKSFDLFGYEMPYSSTVKISS